MNHETIVKDGMALLAFGGFMGLLITLLWPIRKRKPPVVRHTVPASRWPPHIES